MDVRDSFVSQAFKLR